jgi:hypothetical protein
MKSGIFEVQRRENTVDSDPRLQVLLPVQQGVTPGGMATVSELMRGRTIRHNSPKLR